MMPSDILLGIDGNAYNVMGVTAREMKRMGYTEKQIRQYHEEATSSDYDNLLRVSMRYLDDPDMQVEPKGDDW